MFHPVRHALSTAIDSAVYEFCVLPSVLAAALIACALPAARASRVDPNVALRDL